MTVIGPDEKQPARPSRLEEIRERNNTRASAVWVVGATAYQPITAYDSADMTWLLEEVDRLKDELALRLEMTHCQCSDDEACFHVRRALAAERLALRLADALEDHTGYRGGAINGCDDELVMERSMDTLASPLLRRIQKEARDARWLQNAITGSASRGDKTQALDITRAIPRLAEAMVKAIESGKGGG